MPGIYSVNLKCGFICVLQYTCEISVSRNIHFRYFTFSLPYLSVLGGPYTNAKIKNRRRLFIAYSIAISVVRACELINKYMLSLSVFHHGYY